MSFFVLFAGGASFCFCMAVHILFWRFRHPSHHALALFSIFIFPLAVVIPLLWLVWKNLPWPDLASLTLLHVALSCAYIQIYPASQADSPSLKLLLHVRASMPQGMTEGEIYPLFDQTRLFEARIQDLIYSGLVREANGRVCLTPKGRAFIVPFIWFRNLLGLSRGSG